MKKSKTKRIVFIIALLLVAAFVGVSMCPKKYKIGMTWNEVVALANPEKLQLEAAGLDTEGMPKDVLEQEPLYQAYDSRAGLLIQLNYEKKVIKVQRWKYFGIDFVGLAGKWNKR